jgi:hypothetical protein
MAGDGGSRPLGSVTIFAGPKAERRVPGGLATGHGHECACRLMRSSAA